MERVFSGTRIYIKHMQTMFLGNRPPYFKHGLAVGATGKMLMNLSLVGRLETCLREYVCGRVNTMAPLLAMAANLEKSSPLVAPILTKLAFVNVRRQIPLHEFYELMPRYDEAERSCARYLASANCN